MNDNIPYELIAGYLHGDLSSNERESVEHWIHASETNRSAFLEYKRIHEALNETDLPDFDEGAALENVHTDINFIEKPPIRMSPMNIAWLFAAASIAAIVVFYILFAQKVGQQGLQWEIVASEQNIEQFQLPDGSMVWLNKSSELQFPKAFSDSVRLVNFSGEAYFDVTSDTVRPFIIEAKGAVTRVIGTAFNIRARPSDGNVVVSVRKGKVALSDDSGEKKIILDPGEQGTWNRESGEMKEYRTVDENYLSWKTRVLKFEETPIPVVLDQLSELYDVSLMVGDSALRDEKFTFHFKDVTLKEAQEILSWGLKANIDTVDNQLILRKMK